MTEPARRESDVIAALRTARDLVRSTTAELVAQQDLLVRSQDLATRMLATLEEVWADRERLRADVARLREALKPLASHVDAREYRITFARDDEAVTTAARVLRETEQT